MFSIEHRVEAHNKAVNFCVKMFNEPSYFKTGKLNMNSVSCVADVGVRQFVPDEFVFWSF